MTVDIDIDDFWDEVSNDDIFIELADRIRKKKCSVGDIREYFDLGAIDIGNTLNDELKAEELDKIMKILNWDQLRKLVHRLESGDIKL